MKIELNQDEIRVILAGLSSRDTSLFEAICKINKNPGYYADSHKYNQYRKDRKTIESLIRRLNELKIE